MICNLAFNQRYLMKTKLVILFLIFFFVAITIGAKEILQKRNYDTGYPRIMPQLSYDDIGNIAEMDNLEGLMIYFMVNGNYYYYYGYIFDDGSMILKESVDTVYANSLIEDDLAQGKEPTFSQEHVRLLEDAPYGHYFDCYKLTLSREYINRLFAVLLESEKVDTDAPSREPLFTGLMFGLALYFNDKAAIFSGEAYTGDPEYDVNQDLLQYLREVLIPYVQDNSESINQEQFENYLIDKLEKYPFATVWNE